MGLGQEFRLSPRRQVVQEEAHPDDVEGGAPGQGLPEVSVEDAAGEVGVRGVFQGAADGFGAGVDPDVCLWGISLEGREDVRAVSAADVEQPERTPKARRTCSRVL